MKLTKKELEEKAKEAELQNAELRKQSIELEAQLTLLMEANQQLASMLQESNQRTTELFELINKQGFDSEQLLDGKYLLLAYSTQMYRSN
jgi:hypothetical protein